ncbi:MAG: hypothetical protein HFI90_05795 [Clostridia bacterium]|nr:hypothetical protein [Clostridia bacterium]
MHIKKLTALLLVALLCVPLAACPSVLASESVLYPQDGIYTYGNTTNYQVVLPTKSTFQIDSRATAPRSVFVRFDLSGVEAESLTAVQFRLTPSSIGSADNFTVTLLPQEKEHYDITQLSHGYAVQEGLFETGELIYTSPTGMTAANGYLSDNIAEQIKRHLQENTEDAVIALRIGSTAGAGYVIHGTEAPEGVRPALVLETAEAYDHFAAANRTLSAQIGTAVSEDLDLPEQLDDVRLTWRSKTPEILSEDGKILARPAFGETDSEAQLEVEMQEDGYTQTYTYALRVLKAGSAAVKKQESADGTLRLVLSPDNSAAETAGYLLELPNCYFTVGMQYRLHMPDGQTIPFQPSRKRETTKLNVTGMIDGEIECYITGNLKTSDETIVLAGIGAQQLALVQALDELDLGDTGAVTDNLSLPRTVRGKPVQWSSSDPSVLSDSGRVERPFANESNVTVELAAVIEEGGMQAERIFFVNVLKREGGGADAFAELHDPNHMSDETFFGVWNAEKETWTTKPVLCYERYDDLSAVCAYAREGQYEQAKSALLDYYRTRKTKTDYVVKANYDYNLSAEAMNEKIFSFLQMDEAMGMVTVGPEWNYYVADLEPKARDTYFLLDADMDGSTVEIMSKEHPDMHPPVLEIEMDGVKRTYPVVADTYISAGDHKNRNYGEEPILYAREAAGNADIPFGTNTARPYFRFNVGVLAGNITSVQLKFYARSTAGNKKLFVFDTSNENAFDEKELVWSKHYPQAFNFKETGYLWHTQNYCEGTWGVEYEWLHYCSRMYQVSWLIPRYLATGNELYAYRAIELVLSLYEQQQSGIYPRVLEGGWRTEYLTDLIFGALKSSSMTPEVFTALLKYAYQHTMDLRNDTGTWASNWMSAIRVGYTRIFAYLPEMMQEEWWESAKQALQDLYSSKMLNDDGSYMESTSSYISGTIDEFQLALELISAIDGPEDPYYQYILERYQLLTKYYFDMAMNYGSTTPYGDGGRADIITFSKDANLFLPNPQFEFFATAGERGTEPDYTSILYPEKAIAFLRSDWHREGFSATINADFGGNHCHYDDLALDVYAYGTPLLIDAGNSSYSAGSLMSATRKKTISHNTIEIDGRDQAYAKENIPQKLELKTNRLFDFVDAGSDQIYDGFSVNRKVLFLHNSYWIVSDQIDAPEGAHTYRQAWHPDAYNGLSVDKETLAARTNFGHKANIQIVPADPETLSYGIYQNYMYAGVEVNADYLQYYRTDVTGPQTFDTVLYPNKTGETTEVAVERVALNVPTNTASALEITMGSDTGYYYVSHEQQPRERTFGTYETDGQLAYTEKDYRGRRTVAALSGGKLLRENGNAVIESAEPLSDFGAQWNGTTLALFSSAKLPDTGVRIAAPSSVSKVTLNGKTIPFTVENNMVQTGKVPEPEKPGGTTPPSGGGGGTGGAAGRPGDQVPVIPSPTPDTVQPSVPEFSDIEGHWAKEQIERMAACGAVNGVEPGVFQPDSGVTRAQFAVMLVKALKLPAGTGNGGFADVSDGDWFAPYVAAAKNAQMIDGYGDGSFQPDREISRQEMAKLLRSVCAAQGLYEDLKDIRSFSDWQQIEPWAAEAVQATTGFGLMQGMDDGTFAPLSGTTRAQAAVVLCRLLDLLEREV